VNTAAVNTLWLGFLGVAVPVGERNVGTGYGVNILVGGPFPVGGPSTPGTAAFLWAEGQGWRLRESVRRLEHEPHTSGRAQASFFVIYNEISGGIHNLRAAGAWRGGYDCL